jgi:hypothetical protein
MNLVSGHNQPAGHGSVLDGAVWRGAIAKMPKMCEITWNNEGAYDKKCGNNQVLLLPH